MGEVDVEISKMVVTQFIDEIVSLNQINDRVNVLSQHTVQTVPEAIGNIEQHDILQITTMETSSDNMDGDNSIEKDSIVVIRRMSCCSILPIASGTVWALCCDKIFAFSVI